MTLRDQLAATSPKAATTAAFVALNALQDLPAAEQVAGVFHLAFSMADTLGLDVAQLMDAARRRFNDGDTFYQRENKALADYVKNEVRA